MILGRSKKSLQWLYMVYIFLLSLFHFGLFGHDQTNSCEHDHDILGLPTNGGQTLHALHFLDGHQWLELNTWSLTYHDIDWSHMLVMFSMWYDIIWYCDPIILCANHDIILTQPYDMSSTSNFGNNNKHVLGLCPPPTAQAHARGCFFGCAMRQCGRMAIVHRPAKSDEILTIQSGN